MLNNLFNVQEHPGGREGAVGLLTIELTDHILALLLLILHWKRIAEKYTHNSPYPQYSKTVFKSILTSFVFSM